MKWKNVCNIVVNNTLSFISKRISLWWECSITQGPWLESLRTYKPHIALLLYWWQFCKQTIGAFLKFQNFKNSWFLFPAQTEKVWTSLGSVSNPISGQSCTQQLRPQREYCIRPKTLQPSTTSIFSTVLCMSSHFHNHCFKKLLQFQLQCVRTFWLCPRVFPWLIGFHQEVALLSLW